MDIIEDRPFNNSADNALHWNSYIPGLAKSVENWFAPHTPLRAFHVYGMLWTPTNCIFYVDGAQVWQTNSAISHRGEYIDLMVRSSHGRSPARFEEIGTTNTEARFDYVRYYTNALPSVGLAGILNSTASGNSMGKLKIQ
jgi:beta-glucanase (GH16 family)